MRLMAKEDDVYKLMDRRDLYLGAAGLCGIVSVVLLLSSHMGMAIGKICIFFQFLLLE